MKRLFSGVVLAALLSACGSDPTSPPATPTPVYVPSANVRAVASLNFASCGVLGCTYNGQLINDGPDCAQNIRGVTHLFDSAKAELEAQQWTVPLKLRQAEQALYSGCCFTTKNASAPGTYRTDVFFDAVKCP